MRRRKSPPTRATRSTHVQEFVQVEHDVRERFQRLPVDQIDADGDFRRTFQHTEWGAVSVDEAIAMYAWHSRHHAAHIEQALAAAA